MSEARLYLVTPVLTEAAAFHPQLTAALEAGGVTSLLLRFATSDDATAARLIGELAPLAQERGVAVVIAGRPEMVRAASADGAHVDGCGEALTRAIDLLSPDFIVGAGGLSERHDAMIAGEAGADYVLFGENEAADFAATQERVGWWSKLFTTPCVGMARSDAEIAALTRAGADFVMLGDYVWRDPRGPAAAVAEAQRILAEAADA